MLSFKNIETMKKTAVLYFLLFAGVAFATEYNLASFPNSYKISTVNSLAVISSNFVTQIGETDFPAIRTLKGNGVFFRFYPLPVERDYYYENAVLPAGTSVDNQLCLLLNNRLEFFTPDGEFISYTTLSPKFSMSDLRDISGMAFNSQTKTINFLIRNENIYWIEYSFSGALTNYIKMSDSLTNSTSLFLVSTPTDVLLGAFSNQTVSLFYQNGEPVLPSESSSHNLNSPEEVQTAVNNCIATLARIYQTNIPKIIDVSLSIDSLWFQTTDYLFNFDCEGEILNIPLLAKYNFDYYPSSYTAYTEKSPDNSFVWSTCNNKFFTINGFGKNPKVSFWSEIIGNTNPVVDLCIDNSTNWWLLCQTASGAEVLKKFPNGKIQHLQSFKDSPPFSFVKTKKGPLAVAGRYYCSPIEQIAGDNFTTPWQHNLNLKIGEGSSEVISAASITNGAIFFAVRTKYENITWQNSRNTVYIFDYSGNLIKEIYLSSGFVIPESLSSVLAINQNGEIFSLGMPPYVFLYEFAHVDLDNISYISGFNLFSSNLFVFPQSNETIDYYSLPYYSSKKEKSTVLIKPNKKNVAVIFNENNGSLYIIGPNWKSKFLASNPLGQLIKLGNKLEKNPEKTYKKLAKKINKYKAYLKNITIHLDKFDRQINNLYVCAGAKNIKLIDGALNNIRAEYGDEIIPLGSLSIAGKCSGEVNCSQIKNFNIKTSFSGKLKTWFYDIFNVNIDGKCENAFIYSRSNVKKFQVGNSIISSKIRAGISPAGFLGYQGDIKILRAYGDIDSSEIIACADDGNSPGWGPYKNIDNEKFYGSIVTISGRILQRGGRTTFLSKGKNSIFVSKEPIKNLLIQLEDSKVIINGELK